MNTSVVDRYGKGLYHFRMKRFELVLGNVQWDRLKKLKEKTGESVARIVREAINSHLDREEKKAKR
jgi:predicted DNA-binding protein